MRLFTFWCKCKVASRIYLLKCPQHGEPVKEVRVFLPHGRLGPKQKVTEIPDPESVPSVA